VGRTVSGPIPDGLVSGKSHSKPPIGNRRNFGSWEHFGRPPKAATPMLLYLASIPLRQLLVHRAGTISSRGHQALQATMAKKANHHFIPQFYLRNFSVDCDKRKAKVFCYDQSTRKSFDTLVRNVGSRRHFFRIDVDGFDPNHVEDGMAEIEGEISGHLAEAIAAIDFPSDVHFSSVLLLMANVAVRNPRFRSMNEELHRKIANKILRMTLKEKDRFRTR
jgi:hypothetical protein